MATPSIQVAFTIDPVVTETNIITALNKIVENINQTGINITVNADTSQFEQQIRTAAAKALQGSKAATSGIDILGAAGKPLKLTKAQIKQLSDQRRVDMTRKTAAQATMAENKQVEQANRQALKAAETRNRLLMKGTDLQLKYGDALKTTLAPDGRPLADHLDEINKQYDDIGPVEYAKRLGDIERTIKPLVKETDTLGSKMKGLFSQHLNTMIVMAALHLIRRVLQQIYQNVKEIDLAMTELKKVTDETSQSYNAFMNRAGDTAAQLGTTMSNFINATADFARLGYSLTESEALAKVAVVYKNVGDGIETIGDASESVISSLKAFNINANDAMSIIDKFNAVGNTEPISSAGIGEALQRSASALAVANNTIDEAVALAAAGNTVVQNPQQVGELTPNGVVTRHKKIAISVKGRRRSRPRKDFVANTRGHKKSVTTVTAVVVT